MGEHAVRPADLSAYLDGTPGDDEHRRIEEHLEGCSSCQKLLADYAWLDEAVRARKTEPVPTSLDRRVAALLRSKRESKRQWAVPLLWLPRPAVAALVLSVLVIAAHLTGLPNVGVSPAVAAAYLYDDRGEPAIDVQFTTPIDRESVARSVRIEPAVEVTVAWRGDTMVIKPSRQLVSSEQYTLSLKPAGSESAAPPMAMRFPGVVPASPVLLATQATRGAVPSTTTSATLTPTPSATPFTVAAIPSPPLVSIHTASPTATATRTPTPTPTATETITPRATASSPTTSTATAAPTAETAPTATATLTATPVPTPAATATARAPGTASPTVLPTSSSTSTATPMGTVVPATTPTAARTSTLVPAAVGTATPAQMPVPTATATETPKSTATLPPAGPETGPFGSFGATYQGNPGVASQLGPPQAAAAHVPLVVQSFEGGLMLWREDTHQILVLQRDGSWVARFRSSPAAG